MKIETFKNISDEIKILTNHVKDFSRSIEPYKKSKHNKARVLRFKARHK